MIILRDDFTVTPTSPTLSIMKVDPVSISTVLKDEVSHNVTGVRLLKLAR